MRNLNRSFPRFDNPGLSVHSRPPTQGYRSDRRGHSAGRLSNQYDAPSPDFQAPCPRFACTAGARDAGLLPAARAPPYKGERRCMKGGLDERGAHRTPGGSPRDGPVRLRPRVTRGAWTRRSGPIHVHRQTRTEGKRSQRNAILCHRGHRDHREKAAAVAGPARRLLRPHQRFYAPTRRPAATGHESRVTGHKSRLRGLDIPLPPDHNDPEEAKEGREFPPRASDH